MSEGVRLYAGTQAGLIIWRSGNNGWQEVGRHFEDGIIDSIFGCTSAPERVFVGVTHDGLYRTIDGGKSWSKILRGDIRSVTVDPTDDKVIYSGLEPVALYRSEDGGDHWEEMAALQEVRKQLERTGGFHSRPIRAHSQYLHPSRQPEHHLSVHRTWRYRAQLRPWCELGGCQQGHRLSRHPCYRALFAGFGNVARGHASGSGGAGDLMVSRDMGESWQRLDIDLPADRVLWAAAD